MQQHQQQQDDDDIWDAVSLSSDTVTSTSRGVQHRHRKNQVGAACREHLPSWLSSEGNPDVRGQAPSALCCTAPPARPARRQTRKETVRNRTEEPDDQEETEGEGEEEAEEEEQQEQQM